eukprot:224370_1
MIMENLNAQLFLLGLAKISYDLDMFIHWEFGPAQHGKRKVDAFGSMDKRAMRRGVRNKGLIYNTNQTHVVTAANFCTNNWNQHKEKSDAIEMRRHNKRINKGIINSKPKFNLKRSFIAMTDDIDHKPSPNVVHAFKGISS